MTLFAASTVYAQILPTKVASYINTLHLRPLIQVDTISKYLPQNITTISGWHIDYYGSITQNDGPAQLNVYQLIYNDSILHSPWRPYNFKNVKYDSLIVTKETYEFIYLTVQNTELGDNLFIVSKTQDETWFQFDHLIRKDFENNIFLQYSEKYCQATNIPYLQATNIKTNKTVDLKFKGVCYSGKNNWCVDNMIYFNGKLTVTATLTNKRKKKMVTEIRTVEI